MREGSAVLNGTWTVVNDGSAPAPVHERWVTEMLGSRPRLERSGPSLYVHWGEGEQWWLGLESANETFPAS